MPTMATLDLTFSPETRTQVVAFLRSIKTYSPTLCLMKGFTSNSHAPDLRSSIENMATLGERWYYGAYAP
jgi:hypothetical protein